ncbi:MAG: hypothetical protein U1E62_12035 [Alsobacter sp.]
MSEKHRALHPNLTPIGLSRVEAAEFIGVSPTLFDQLVTDGRMPAPKEINSRVVWSRPALEKAFTELPERSVRIFGGSNHSDAWGDLSV